MSDITLKKTLFTRAVEGTDRKGGESCRISARTVVFSGFWKYEVAVDTPLSAFRTSGHFLQILQDMKKTPVAKQWMDLLREVAGTVCDNYGSATYFFTEEQMLVIAALKNRDMSVEDISGLLSMKRSDAFTALARLESLDLVSRMGYSSADVAKKKYGLAPLGDIVQGVLMEDRKYSLMQATVDSLMA